MAVTTIGRIGQVWQGTYDASTAYVVDDVVEHGGGAYICKLASTGNAPTNTTYWDNMATASGLSSIGSLAAGDIVYYNGSAWARLGKGSAGQGLKVNSGGNGLEYGTVGTVVKVHWFTDRNRRNHGSSNRNQMWSNVNFINKVRADSYLVIEGEIPGKQNQGNDKALKRLAFSDSAGNVWEFTGSYRGNGGHSAALNPAPFVCYIGPTAQGTDRNIETHRTSGSATTAAAGQMTWSAWMWCANNTGSGSWTTTNPDNNDDNRLWEQSDNRAQHIKAIVYEVLV